MTSIRFFAALYVVFYHLAPSALRSPSWFRHVVEGGYVGVSFFFVLSGFILAINYLDRINAVPMSRREFWRARFARIYPVYALALLVWALFEIRTLLRTDVTSASVSAVAEQAVLVFGLLQSWFPAHALDWNEPAWTLSVEAFFYLTFPWIAQVVVRLSAAQALRAAAACWAVGMLLPLAYASYRPDGVPLDGFGSPTLFWFNAVRFGPWAHLPQFLVGMLAARAYLNIRDRDLKGWWQVHTSMLVLLVGGIALLLVAVLTPKMYLFINNGLLAPLFAVIIVLVSLDRGMLHRLLSLPLLLLLGEASYALYIGHLLPIAACWAATAARVSILMPLETVAGFAAYSLAAVLLSVITLRAVEVPARRALRRRGAPVLQVQPSAW